MFLLKLLLPLISILGKQFELNLIKYSLRKKLSSTIVIQNVKYNCWILNFEKSYLCVLLLSLENSHWYDAQFYWYLKI